jgi:hypothetical protein
MNNVSSSVRAVSVRIQAWALVGALLIPGIASPIAACAEDELPSAPGPKLQLQGTLASVKVAPSKLDNGPAQASAPPAAALQITILEGEDVSNNIKERTAREPIVQVTDENHKPVAGAAVLFTIDSGGGHAGATFLSGAKTYTGTTDAEGKVVAHGFKPNAHAGQFHINVTATKGPLTTHTTIAQTNVAAATAGATTGTVGAFVATHVVLVSVIAAGVVAGTVAGVAVATKSSPTTITTGTGTVGAPTISGARIGVRK